MNWLDISLLCLSAAGFVKGLFDGIIKQVATLAALLLAILFCGSAAAWVSSHFINQGSSSSGGITVMSYIIGFLLIVFIVIIVGKLMSSIVNATPLALINHLVGGLLGLFLAVIFLSLFLNVIEIIGHDVIIGKQTKSESMFYTPIQKVVPTIYPFFLLSKQ